MAESEYVIGRRAGGDGQPVGEGHAVLRIATRKGAPFPTECGGRADLVVGDWPPEGGAEGRACPVCTRDTDLPWA
jgi:hypothetical protein